MTSNDDSLRKEALERITKRRDFGAHLLAYVAVNALLVAIWAITGAGFFWPIFPIMGWGIGVAFHALDTYRGEPTETEISAEMNKIRRRRGE